MHLEPHPSRIPIILVGGGGRGRWLVVMVVVNVRHHHSPAVYFVVIEVISKKNQCSIKIHEERKKKNSPEAQMTRPMRRLGPFPSSLPSVPASRRCYRAGHAGAGVVVCYRVQERHIVCHTYAFGECATLRDTAVILSEKRIKTKHEPPTT